MSTLTRFGAQHGIGVVAFEATEARHQLTQRSPEDRATLGFAVERFQRTKNVEVLSREADDINIRLVHRPVMPVDS